MCHIIIETPVSLNSEQKSLLESFEQSLLNNNKNNPKAFHWFEGVKKFFESKK